MYFSQQIIFCLARILIMKKQNRNIHIISNGEELTTAYMCLDDIMFPACMEYIIRPRNDQDPNNNVLFSTCLKIETTIPETLRTL